MFLKTLRHVLWDISNNFFIFFIYVTLETTTSKLLVKNLKKTNHQILQVSKFNNNFMCKKENCKLIYIMSWLKNMYTIDRNLVSLKVSEYV